MATGRTTNKWMRVYVDGYDLSGFARKAEPLELTHTEADLTALSDAVRGYLPNHPQVNVGAIDAVFDNTATTGLHAVVGTAGSKRTVSVCIGIRGVPAEGDPVFSGVFTQGAYQVQEDGGAVTASIPFSGWATDATTLSLAAPWGVLLNANTARTAVNAAVGVDDRGAATANGGYMTYHVTAGNGTATIKVQDAAINTNPNFSDLAGATTGSINCAVVQHGIVAATTTTVRQYLRWQIVLGTATTVTFVLSFNRA